MRDNIVEVINGVGKFSEYDRNNSKMIDKYNDISFLYVSKIENSIMSITFDELEKMFLYLQRICDPFSSGITDASNAARVVRSLFSDEQVWRMEKAYVENRKRPKNVNTLHNNMIEPSLRPKPEGLRNDMAGIDFKELNSNQKRVMLKIFSYLYMDKEIKSSEKMLAVINDLKKSQAYISIQKEGIFIIKDNSYKIRIANKSDNKYRKKQNDLFFLSQINKENIEINNVLIKRFLYCNSPEKFSNLNNAEIIKILTLNQGLSCIIRNDKWNISLPKVKTAPTISEVPSMMKFILPVNFLAMIDRFRKYNPDKSNTLIYKKLLNMLTEIASQELYCALDYGKDKLSLRIKDVDPYAENLISGLIFYQVAYSLLNLSDKKPAYYFQDPESLCFVGYETKVKEGKDFYFAISKRNSDGSISEGSGFFAIIKD